MCYNEWTFIEAIIILYILILYEWCEEYQQFFYSYSTLLDMYPNLYLKCHEMAFIFSCLNYWVKDLNQIGLYLKVLRFILLLWWRKDGLFIESLCYMMN